MNLFLKKSAKIERSTTNGFGIVEIVVAIAVVATSLFAMATVAKFSFQKIQENSKAIRATFLAQEGIEMVRAMRDISWKGLIAPAPIGEPLYPFFDGHWRLYATDPGALDGIFSRTVTISDVYRRTSDNDIVDASFSGPKSLDPDLRLVTVRVVWGTGMNASTTISTYFTNLFKN